MLAAADAPASPEPTTMTVCFRLFAGFTSFISNRCRSHFRSSGPDGIFDARSLIVDDSSLRCSPPSLGILRPSLGWASMDDPGDHAERNDGEAEPDRDGEAERDPSVQRMLGRLGVAERAERAPRTLEEVESERHHGDEVEPCHPPDVEA